MKILLTGGAGYVGSACLRLLKQSGHQVVAFDNLVEGHPAAVDGAELVVGDIRDMQLVEQTLREYNIEAVMHFAAATNVGESVVNPAYHYDNNIGGTLSLLNAMVAVGVKKILFSSTCATYGLNPVSPMAEDAAQDPCSPYARTKLAVEWMIRDFATPMAWAIPSCATLMPPVLPRMGALANTTILKLILFLWCCKIFSMAPRRLNYSAMTTPLLMAPAYETMFISTILPVPICWLWKRLRMTPRRYTTSAPAMVSRCWILSKRANWSQAIRRSTRLLSADRVTRPNWLRIRANCKVVWVGNQSIQTSKTLCEQPGCGTRFVHRVMVKSNSYINRDWL